MAATVGGWLASAFIAKLVDKVSNYAGDQYGYQMDGIKDKLRSLEKNLSSIRTVVDTAERLQDNNTNMGSWLGRIKDAARQAEDVLDLFGYRVLESQAEDRRGKVSSAASANDDPPSSSSTTTISTAASSTTTSSSSTAKQSVGVLKSFFLSDEDINQFIAVVDVFVEIHSHMQTFLELVKLEDRRPEQRIQWRKTTSMLGTSNFFGRVNEEQHLKKLLAQINEQSSNPYDVISVVGIGGVGKTALVQKVYSEYHATNHFDLTVWLYVTDKFDVERLTKEIVQSDNLDIYADLNSSSLDQAQRILQEKLNGKRILMVLDDVWNELSSQWENLCKPLQFAGRGSKVIVTTRSENVATTNGSTEMMHLDGLEDEDYWKHFLKCAFGDADPSHFPQLQIIGEQLVRKLAGSPLAAKTVGCSLKLELDESHWRAISRSKLWQIEQKEDDIISSLRLSYKHLPDHLKQCFVYFALFPKKYQLRGDVLIQMWRAHGFLTEKTTDEAAYHYINDLLKLSFIQKAANQEGHYVVHDLLHDFAESVSNGEHFRIEDDFNVCIPRNVRHLYVSASNISRVYMSLQESKELKQNPRSLVICKEGEGGSCDGIPWSNFNTALEQTLQELRGLRVLVLRNPDGVLPDNIHHLVHLRYLNIHESASFINVPELLFKLYHLQGLDLQANYQNKMMKKELQKGLSRLTQLRYLKAPRKIISGIELIGGLKFLQELEEYHVKNDCRHTISQLKDLKELGGMLSIKNLENVRCREESHRARLSKKENLKQLSLCWNHLKQGIDTDHEGVFEGLRPHPNLRELRVAGYMGIRSPSWLSREHISSIQSVELLFCHHWKTLPPFGSLPFLKTLKIRHCTAVEKIDAHFYGTAAVAFPSLEELLFEDMHQWKEWSSGVEIEKSSSSSSSGGSPHVFPRLRRLCVQRCSKLMGPLPLPLFNQMRISVSDYPSENIITECGSENTANANTPFSFELNLDRMGLVFGCLETRCLATIHTLHLSSYHLIAFNKEQEELLQHLTSVKELRFAGCPELTTLPSSMVHLTSLESLYVEKCPKLESFPPEGLPPCLKKLSVIRCHKKFSQLSSEINMDSNSRRIEQVIVKEPTVCSAKKRRRTSSS